MEGSIKFGEVVRLIALFLVFFFCQISVVFGETKPVIINKERQKILLSDFEQFISNGPYDTYSYKDFVSKTSNFRQVEAKHSSTQGKDNTYWIKFDVEGDILVSEHYFLEFKDSRVNHFDIWINGKRTSETVGTAHDFEKRIVNHKSLIIILPREKEIEVVVRINDDDVTFFNFQLWKPYKFQRRSLLGYITLGALYGFFFLGFLAGLIILINLADIRYLGFSVTMLAILLTCIIYDGMAFQFLWPNHPSLNSWVPELQLILLLGASLFYFLCFFDVLDISRKDVQTLLIITVFCILGLLGLGYVQGMSIHKVFYVTPFLSIVPIYIRQMKAIRFTGGKHIGWAFIFVLYALFYYAAEQFLPLGWYNVFNRHSPHFAGVAIMLASGYTLFLNLAFYSKATALERNKSFKILKQLNEIKERTNIEIQEKVQLQTKELEEKNVIISSQVLELKNVNEELRIKSEQILKLNLDLNQENEDLKTNVKKIKESRIFQNTIPFDDFKDHFDSDDACYELLEEMKWAKGFSCLKCGNAKYGRGKGELARRCSKCGANESVTANTVFHRVHFPILKAFYILFLVNKHGDKLKYKEISESVDLRLATCWKFSKKVKARREEMFENGKQIDSWIDLII